MSRQEEIYNYLLNAKKAVNGTVLSQEFNVSRQAIVQDIALLRASGYDIISTNRGYLVNDGVMSTRLCLTHSNDDIKAELYAIIDNGGTIKNVIIKHPVYHEITAPLDLATRKEVDEFVTKMEQHQGIPLKELGDGYTHYHEITAPSKKILDNIIADLDKLGFLIKD